MACAACSASPKCIGSGLGGSPLSIATAASFRLCTERAMRPPQRQASAAPVAKSSDMPASSTIMSCCHCATSVRRGIAMATVQPEPGDRLKATIDGMPSRVVDS